MPSAPVGSSTQRKAPPGAGAAAGAGPSSAGARHRPTARIPLPAFVRLLGEAWTVVRLADQQRFVAKILTWAAMPERNRRYALSEAKCLAL